LSASTKSEIHNPKYEDLIMRISSSTVTANALFNVQQSSERFFRAQQAVSTGKRITQLSDDPASLPDDLTLHAAIGSIDQYQKNIDDAQGFLGSSDIAVGNALTLLRNARMIAVQGSTDGVSSDNREILANQVDGLVNALATVANSAYGTRYLFGGQHTTQPPFVQQANNYVYKGGTRANGDGDIRVDIASQQPITINRPGDEVFNTAFQALKDLRDNLHFGQPVRISEDSLPSLDKVLDTLTSFQADFGAKGAQLKLTSQRYDTMKNDFTAFLSNIEDADMPASIVQLNTAQTALQAALTASSRSFQQSLLDFLK
jgi:flagellar hook-associated protein 3 FlgL